MLDPDTATETELRRYLNDNGVMDWEHINNIHPRSHELRDGGFSEHADILDQYYQMFTAHSVGWTRLFTLEELREKAKEIQDAQPHA